MYALLERNMLTKMHYKVNSTTELDFLLYFSHYIFEEPEAKDLVAKCLPWVYFISVNYALSRTLAPAAVALAAICFELEATSESLKLQRDQLI